MEEYKTNALTDSPLFKTVSDGLISETNQRTIVSKLNLLINQSKASDKSLRFAHQLMST